MQKYLYENPLTIYDSNDFYKSYNDFYEFYKRETERMDAIDIRVEMNLDFERGVVNAVASLSQKAVAAAKKNKIVAGQKVYATVAMAPQTVKILLGDDEESKNDAFHLLEYEVRRSLFDYLGLLDNDTFTYELV